MVLEATNIGSIVNSDKENRVKLAWQEKDENGFPVNKCKNFPYKSETKKIYRKERIDTPIKYIYCSSKFVFFGSQIR